MRSDDPPAPLHLPDPTPTRTTDSAHLETSRTDSETPAQAPGSSAAPANANMGAAIDDDDDDDGGGGGGGNDEEETTTLHLDFTYSRANWPADLPAWDPRSHVVAAGIPLSSLNRRLKALVVGRAGSDLRLRGYLRRRHQLIFRARARLSGPSHGSGATWVDCSEMERRGEETLLSRCLVQGRETRGVDVDVQLWLRDCGEVHGRWEMHELVFPHRPWLAETVEQEEGC